MFPPIRISLELVNVVALKFVVAPMAPSNVIIPLPASMVSAGDPLIVEVEPLNVIALLVDVSAIVCELNVTGPVYVCVPLPLVIAWVKVIPPLLLKLILPFVVNPTVLTVPTVKPEFSKNDTAPVLPASVVIALLVLVSV